MSATAATFSDAITAFFNKFDVDGDGHITIAELVKMMETLRKETNAKALNAPKKAAKLVLNALDTNTNGMIELHEFVAWTKKGVSLTMEKREKFAKSAPERADLVGSEVHVRRHWVPRALRGPRSCLQEPEDHCIW